MQIGHFQRDIAELTRSNKDKYQAVLKNNPAFAHQLYKIGEFQALGKSFGKELLMRQLDRLLDEKSLLDRELHLIKFKDEEKSQERAEMVAALEENHSSILKRVWSRSKEARGEALGHLEDLNNAIGVIKGSIINMTRLESTHSKESEENYLRHYFQNIGTRLSNPSECSHCK